MQFKANFKRFDGGTDSIHLCAHTGYVSVSRVLCVTDLDGFSQEQVRLNREQAAHVAAELTRWLEATAPVDPAYEAYADQSAAAIPANEDEWKARLADGCKS